MANTLRIVSTFALLDVMGGRHELKERLEAGEAFDVVIRGRLTRAWGDDDGMSREFEVEVTSATLQGDQTHAN